MTRLPSLTALLIVVQLVKGKNRTGRGEGNQHPRLSCCRRISARKSARQPVWTDGKPREFAHLYDAEALRPLTTTVVPSRMYCRHSRGPGSKTWNPRSGPTSNGLTWAGLTDASPLVAVPMALHPRIGGGMPPAPTRTAPTPAAQRRRGPAMTDRPAAARCQTPPLRHAPSPRFPWPRADPAPAATAARPGPEARRPAAQHCSGSGDACRCARTGERRNSDLRPMPAASWQRALPAILVGSTQTVNLPSRNLHCTG
jgi:hypothetical protein